MFSEIGKYSGAEHVKFSLRTPVVGDMDLASQISGWMKDEVSMIPKQPEQLLASFENGYSIIVMYGDTPVSHAAVTAVYPDGKVEVGTLVTDKAFRGKGAGSLAAVGIVSHAKALFPGSTIIALANEQSLPMFSKLGADEMKPYELHTDVWSLCEECPRKPLKNSEECGEVACCDTPVNVSNITN